MKTIKLFQEKFQKLKIQQNEVLLGKKATNPISYIYIYIYIHIHTYIYIYKNHCPKFGYFLDY